MGRTIPRREPWEGLGQITAGNGGLEMPKISARATITSDVSLNDYLNNK